MKAINELERFERDIAGAKHMLQTINIVAPVLCFAIVLLEHCVLMRWASPCKDFIPLLSGAPQFTVLTLIVGLAAYLRVVRNGAIELRDKIRQGEVKHYPFDDRFEFTKDKMALLDDVANKMSIAGPFFIYLMVVVGGRITYETFLKLMGVESQCNQRLFIADTIIVLWMLVGLVFLAVAHFSARRKDEEIRIAARRQENDAILFSLNNNVKEPPSES